MTLQEVKLVLDWTKQKLDIIRGARLSNPEEYNKWYDYHKGYHNGYLCEDEGLEQIFKTTKVTYE